MVKAFVSALVGFLIFIGASVFETVYVTKSFNNFHTLLSTAYEKIESETAVKEDVLTAQEFWIKKKESLHMFIPHNDIKEIDLWVTEAVTLVEKEMWNEALSKIEVCIELVEQIPKTFLLRIENIL